MYDHQLRMQIKKTVAVSSERNSRIEQVLINRLNRFEVRNKHPGDRRH